MSEMIRVEGVNKVYDDGVHALKNINFSVKKGEFLGVIGLSGSGKSTLLRCINRLIEASNGKIEIQGSIVFCWNGKQILNTYVYHKQIFIDSFELN
jgi:phosphonate transport system ATP-binding protein